jgi:hypothetical protein
MAFLAATGDAGENIPDHFDILELHQLEKLFAAFEGISFDSKRSLSKVTEDAPLFTYFMYPDALVGII